MARAKNAFPLYDCTVRLGGSRNNEVTKTAVTAPEITLLAAVHGPDAVVQVKRTKQGLKVVEHTDHEDGSQSENVKFVKQVDRSDREERARLTYIFEGANPTKIGFVQRVFGPASIPLPRDHDEERLPETAVEMQTVPAELKDVIEPHAALVG